MRIQLQDDFNTTFLAFGGGGTPVATRVTRHAKNWQMAAVEKWIWQLKKKWQLPAVEKTK